MKNQHHIFNAKTLVRQQHSGVLSTLSVSLPGYPFGSIVPYFMTNEGNIIIYISQIAQHTRNIKADAKVSMTLFDALEDDSQAAGRVTLLGDAKPADSDELMVQYLALFPQSQSYKQTHDFQLYQIDVQRVRFIGGFGQIFWISKEDWLITSTNWQQISHGIVAHMNEDHQDAMRAIIAHQFNYKASSVMMVSSFQEGAHIRADTHNYYLPFSAYCTTAQEVRQQLVDLTQAARAALASNLCLA
ncbi:HugZ family pyridoxamine 5'-phosphate oxidase [Flavobacterium sp. W21_SRS_FM6]|uniref:HugZ family pyridoxamine 5'-phosphate oxidase n=1 Tax=Flavobacterium sp. W21_SRS_FM6 TaxID=3240268 RepID=UPI003F8DD9CD